MAGQVAQQGWSQQTAAVRTLISQAFGSALRSASKSSKKRRSKSATGGGKKRKSRASTSTRRKASSSRSSKKPARMVKGSLAAKRYMASIRKKRK